MKNEQTDSGLPPASTVIYRRRMRDDEPHDELIGYLTESGEIMRKRGFQVSAIGRADAGRIYRYTKYDPREVGWFDDEGNIFSHGLLEGGKLGWVDRDGVVIQGGLIFGEEEVGIVAGPNPTAAAAALLLILLPDEAELDKRMMQR